MSTKNKQKTWEKPSGVPDAVCLTDDNCVVVLFTVCRLCLPFCSTSASQCNMVLVLVNENVFRVLPKECLIRQMGLGH